MRPLRASNPPAEKRSVPSPSEPPSSARRAPGPAGGPPRDPLRRLERRRVKAAVPPRLRVDDTAAAQRVVGIADDEAVSLHGGDRSGEPGLGPGRLARRPPLPG